MSKYALIKEGIIVQIQPNKQDGFIEVPEDVVCGMILQDDVFVNPPKTQDQIEDDISIARDEAMLQGFSYNGQQISVTKDDADGVMQVNAAFALGLTDTVIHFRNGVKMPIAAADFQEFALLFVTKRNSFFTV